MSSARARGTTARYALRLLNGPPLGAARPTADHVQRFLPSVKLLSKQRVGARQRRCYDAPRTPLERVQASATADPAAVAQLVALRNRLDPFTLAAIIDRKLERLVTLATSPRRLPTPPAASAPSPRRQPRRPPHLKDFTLAITYAGPCHGLRG